MPDFSFISSALEGVGLRARGAYLPDTTDSVPKLAGDRAAAVVVLCGNIGDSMWKHFSASPEFRDKEPNPLDRWSRRLLNALAENFGGEGVCQAVFPFDGPPYLPFQQWAQKAEPVSSSPLGPLIHSEYGQWHAYRGALVFAEPFDLPARQNTANPCLSCTDQPCLTTCPVDAFSKNGYDVPSCVRHLALSADMNCNQAGCLARRACPVGQTFLYPPEQTAFHTKAFLQSASVMSPKDPV